MKAQISVQTPTKMSDKKLLATRMELKSIIADAEEALAKVDAEFMNRLTTSGETKLSIEDKTISLCTRLSFKDVPMDVAKKFRAVKKVVDSSVLKPLYQKGVNIPNVTSSQYISVR